MDNTTLDTLQYREVLNDLCGFASNPLGVELVMSLRPLLGLDDIKEAYSELKEAFDIIQASGRLALAGAADLSPLLSKIAPQGAYLLQDELMLVKGTVETAALLKALLKEPFQRSYPKLSAKIASISGQEALLSALMRILDEKGQIKDTASHELFRIRRELKGLKERSRSILEKVSNDKKFKEYLQEEFITIRDDRYVLCIKAGMHANVGGIIHGRSGSGAAYFIEPIEIVELNNRIAILKKEESAEEIEILRSASLLVSGQKGPLIADLEVLGGLDLVQAKALYARQIRAIAPFVARDGEVRLTGARHPILEMEGQRGGPPVVPIDIFIPKGCSVLVISGANTGGKTVALKTLGLLTLMVLSGMPVPVDEGSEAMCFASIFSDIGDRQDIIASLSTFSAHIVRIREFLAFAGPGSLVLMDEIGAGTDPAEGGALALAALEEFRAKGALSVVTTHLNLLKAHAQIDPRYVNASVEFDETTLKPLYRLHYGVPGPSLGLSIAQSLGIPEGVIARARGNLRENEGAFIESVRILEREREEVGKLKARLETLEFQRREALKKLKEKRDLIAERTRARMDKVVLDAKEEIRKTIERLKEERGAGVPSKKALTSLSVIAAKAAGALGAGPMKAYVPKAGDRAAITGSSTKGVVLKVDEEGRRAELQIGAKKVWVAWEKLVKKGGGEALPVSQEIHVSADMKEALSLNIIGMRVEEALPIVTRFLDNAHANGLGAVDIIHGVGTGRLARAVHEYLGSSPVVKRFYHGDQARGGAGVTVVELS